MLPSSHSTVFVSICLSVTKLPWLIMCTKASPPQKVPSVKWAELNLAHTILTIHHSCLLEQSRKRGNSERRGEGKRKSHLCTYVWTTHSCPLLFFVTMTMMMFLHRRGQRHICLKRNKRKTVSSICDAGILFMMTNYHSGSIQRAFLSRNNGSF